jgi:GRASP55/65 PDZ-like domain
VVGTKEIAFKSLEEFAKYVEVNQGTEITLHLYNLDSEKVREVTLTPSREWGGQGLLGCDVSFGYFNKIPHRQLD